MKAPFPVAGGGETQSVSYTSMMIRSKGFEFARILNSRVAYFVPHSFLFAILLTFIAYFLGVFITYQGPFDMVKFWVNGVWNLLPFSMQMVLMVAAGFRVARAPVSQRILRSMAVIFRTPRSAAMFLTALTAFCSLLNWGLGIIAGAFLAREMGRRIPRSDYALLVAVFSGWVASAASPATFLPLVYSDAVILNLFAPTSGAVWGIQAPLMVKTAESLNASLPRAIQAISAGETIGNVIHPFWTILLMGICGLSLRDIMGYCLMAFVILSMIWVLCFNFLAG
ncbi:MAG TPA: TIGR00366 family protein [Thermodesulfobacteriota bacterium]|nr:TIGR00366 family protein [Thermodesulfobacteriota bacterium]